MASQNEWDVICALATGAAIEVEDDGTYRLVKRMGDVPDHIVMKLFDLGMLCGSNCYRLSDEGHRCYMQRVDGRTPVIPTEGADGGVTGGEGQQ